jgi:ankyrin repeat protein
MNIWDVFESGINRSPPAQKTVCSLFNLASRGQVEKFVELASNDQYSAEIEIEVNGFNCFLIACKKGHLSIVEKAATMFPHVLKTRTLGDCRNGMMLAAFEGHLSIVQFLANLDATFSVEKDANDNTAIHYAAWGGHLSVLKFLVEVMECDPSARNNEGLTPLQFAAAGNYSEIVSYLSIVLAGDSLSTESSSSGLNALHRAAIYGALDTVTLLLATTSDPSALLSSVTANQSTAVHLAAQHGRLAVLQLLLDHGCDLNTQNEYGLAPLHYACIG